MKSKFDKSNHLKKYKEYIHICCTSEDINNLSYALMVDDGRKVILAKINDLNKILKSNIIEVDLRINGRAIIKIDGDKLKVNIEEV